MKKFLFGLLVLASLVGAKPTEAHPYFWHTGVGITYAGWGWYPVTGIGFGVWPYPYYGYSYYPYWNYQVYYASYGAISYSPSTGATGYSYGFATQAEAMANANGYCNRGDCRTVVWVQGGCAAVATSEDNSRLGWGYDNSRFAAQSRAIRGCKAGIGSAAKCAIRAWTCSWGGWGR